MTTKFVSKRQAAMIERGYRWGVYHARHMNDGEVLSVHKTLAAAERARGDHDFRGVAELSLQEDRFGFSDVVIDYDR
jgi:hypothetical protein